MPMETLTQSNLALTWSQRDRQAVWHPWTQMQLARDFIPIVRGEGAMLYADDGRSYLDGTSSWWVNLHGHAHPTIVAAIHRQSEQLEHVGFADFTHPLAITLAERLLQLVPGGMSKVFYSDNGSTAVEVAIKMALQYWHNKCEETSRRVVICMRGSFHGETFGAMSAAGKNGWNKPFWQHLFQVEMVDPPLLGQEERSIAQLQAILQQNKAACFIFEPLVLGVGGMIFYSASGLESLLRLCRDQGVLTIADEVMTGFGRTEALFACETLSEQPDMMCLAKGLTGGFLPLAVTVCREEIYRAFLSENMTHALLHGHSYTANPVACSAAIANLDLLEDRDCEKQRQRITRLHRSFCGKWRGHPRLVRCESLGTVLVLEYRVTGGSSYYSPLRHRLYYYFLDHGILLRPLGNVLYVMPPYCMSTSELQYIYDHIGFTVENF